MPALPMKIARGGILRFTADRFTVGYVLTLFALELVVWHEARPLVALLAALPLFLLSLVSAPIHHNHQHVNVFRSPVLNRLFELPLALQTGVGPYSWTLHHNLGHHLNYLKQHPDSEVDESHWTRPDGTPMGRVEYTLHLFFCHPRDIYTVGRRHPRLYRRYLLMRIPLYALLGTLLWIHPVNGFIVFVATPMATLLHTCWVTYEHHAGLGSHDPLHASRNRIHRLYNLLSQNLGYHTAHHLRPGLHWSLLPAYHEEIQAGIPESQKNPAFF